MGRPQVDSPAVYPPARPPPPPPESDPQPQPFSYATEHHDPTAYPPGEITPATAYESSCNTETPQAYNEAPVPSSYPPTNDSSNPQQFPPQNPPNNMTYPPQAATYPPNNHPSQFPKPMGYGPQPVNFPPRDPAATVPQQFPPPPPSPHKHFQQNVAAQGIPMQQQQFTPVPVQRYGPNMGSSAWTTGLFDCMDDPQNALITAFFPCLTFGQIAEIVDSGHTTCGTSGLMYGCIACLIALPCLLSCTYRTKLRSQYDLVEAPAPDWATHFLCEWCALCQEYRELRNRGLDPEIGWHGNMMKNQNQQPQVAMMPPMNQSMMG
ncbi:protein PLANT CADMIUM RESISTANCE 6-like [Magnolia sinica]|uniref:protein PLANT CADMIUM RESISTANCE 6-like n=1 Tax=Magnolia sinica TaxID=86752 RepID=UPI0026594D0A|nr:protein PLANT CADMIUM RESISTANCE 6-like [Magnolia sinica]